jgi:hypothetical protein
VPGLIILAACERVIFDRVGVASLINIFHRIEMPAPPAELPTDAVAPVVWNVFTQWHHGPDTVGREYVQRTEVLKPDGTPHITVETPFTVTEENAYTRHQIQINGLPIARAGFFKIRVWLDNVPNSTGEYELELRYKEAKNES